MRVRLFAPLTAALVAGTVALTAGTATAAPAPAAAPAVTAPATTAVGVPIPPTSTPVGTFSGTFTPQRFSNNQGQLMVTGLVTGTLTAADGTVSQVSQTVTAPAQVTGSCSILNLTLGPLDLDLLGLVVHLDTVHLTITAQQGPGNLLGNLLCAVANLLNSGSPLGSLSGLLNQILGILQGL